MTKNPCHKLTITQAPCDQCGKAADHSPEDAHGFFCATCCPTCSPLTSDAKQPLSASKAMLKLRRREVDRLKRLNEARRLDRELGL